MGNLQGKSLPVAIVLNLVLPGAGYMYLGRVVLGLAAFALVVLMFATSGLLLLIPTWLGINLIMAIDMVILFNKHKAAGNAATTYPCPFCAERIQRAASICRFCKSTVTPSDDSPATDIYTQGVGNTGGAFKTVMATIAVLLLLGVVGLFLFTRSNSGSVIPVASEQSLDVTPGELVSQYERNEVAADQRYKGKLVTVSGRVSKIGKDFLNTPYVTLDTGIESTFRELQCELASEALTESTRLAPGDRVTMRGKVLGLMVHVQLDGCTFVKARAATVTKDSRPESDSHASENKPQPAAPPDGVEPLTPLNSTSCDHKANTFRVFDKPDLDAPEPDWDAEDPVPDRYVVAGVEEVDEKFFSGFLMFRGKVDSFPEREQPHYFLRDEWTCVVRH